MPTPGGYLPARRADQPAETNLWRESEWGCSVDVRWCSSLPPSRCPSCAACGGGDDDDERQRRRRRLGEAKKGGSITMSQTSQPDFMDPALGYTVNGIEPLWLVYTPLLTYPRTGDAEKDSLADPGPGQGPAEDLQGRQDLRADAAHGPQVLGRLARQGLRLRALGQARAQPGVGRLGLLPRHHGRAGLRRRRQVRRRHQGHHDRRQDRQDHDPPRRAGRLVLERAGDVVRRRSSRATRRART